MRPSLNNTFESNYNNINSQVDATITNFIDNYNQLNMFRADNFAHPQEQ